MAQRSRTERWTVSGNPSANLRLMMALPKDLGEMQKSQCQEGMETTSGWGRKDPAEKRTKSPIQQRGSVRCRRLPSEIPWLLVCNRFVGGGNAKRMGMRVGSWERG